MSFFFSFFSPPSTASLNILRAPKIWTSQIQVCVFCFCKDAHSDNDHLLNLLLFVCWKVIHMTHVSWYFHIASRFVMFFHIFPYFSPLPATLSSIHCADVSFFPPKTLSQSASSVLHPGIALATGNGQFGCSDSFPPAVLLCPPTMQGM